MKKLYIVRHALKELEQLDQDDYDRALSQSGIDDAKLMAQRLAAKGIKADLIVSSPAKRTKETSEIFAEALNYDKSIMYNEVLYMAYVNELIETITYTFDTVDTMILIAHNPSLTALAITLVGLKEKIAMGGIVEVEFNCDSWIDISKENAKFISYDYPNKK
ncbi:SixA phosphatase family protein [Poseidonibacter lekithochrous]|uniref:SixA phosphatase family protein n=1 Tax=Poseidonibacter lekithochrous TaxID=1904463 RepID=UPI0008FC9AC4|nr:histidine phosphatase family protein [Poseidonibacter lekithochrous]QKJ23911.1 phosphohistidine phosphatase [Poseidonibacter lekithochrous]